MKVRNDDMVQPRNDWVLCEIIRQDMTEGGLALPKNSGSRSRARVVRVGPGDVNSEGVRIPIDLKPGDEVMVVLDPTLKGPGFPVVSHDPEMVLIPEHEIAAVHDVKLKEKAAIPQIKIPDILST